MKKKKSKKTSKKKPAASKSKVSPKAKLKARGAQKKAPSKRVMSMKKREGRLRSAGSSQSVETVQLKPRALRARAGAGGGDFGGVSTVERVDSESVDELLEEGQAFEAGIVSGVEDAPDADQGEVRTREIPQDDVPE